ncbi:hypothetical protein ACIPZC_16710 [Pseudomonas sp. NPDC089743]|uniref:hypothetical protein n=1 Tax=Pseudomonas sp. NPDC089743 TaxID=3364471 RepID=UPI003802EAA7
MRRPMLGVFLIAVAGMANAGIPLVNATCPGDIEVHADEGGPVYINAKEAKVKKFSDAYYEAKGAGVTVSIMVNPDESVGVSYTGKGGANGVCELTEQD